MKKEFKIINYQSEAYAELLHIRHEILRKPLGLSIYDDPLDEEDDEIHFACYVDHKMVGCILLKDLGNGVAKMRQVAVLDSYQGLGLGNFILDSFEKYAQEHQFKSIMLYARETSVGFYQKKGYKIIGGLFLEIGIPHFKLLKHLS